MEAVNDIFILMENKNNFFCHGCGLCCKSVGRTVENSHKLSGPIKKLFDKFEFNTTPEGACEMLDVDNTCKVYDSRPTICNVDKMKEITRPEMSWDEYYAFEEDCCKILMVMAGISKEEIKKIYNDRVVVDK